jgi:ABC-type transport system involved in multi-copper enzyme maturation permease subunit
MSNIWHLAVNTFRESVRDRVLYVILFFAVLMVFASRAIGWISVGQQIQIVKHFSLAAISFFGALIAVFIGASLIHKETDKRTIYTILSKPVRRWQFVLGKFLGLAAVLFLVVGGMGVAVAAFVGLSLGGAIDLVFVQAVFLTFLEVTVITAVAILLSTAASPILAAIVTFSTYLVGQVTPSLMSVIHFKPLTEEQMELARGGNELAIYVSQTHTLLKPLSQLLYVVIPNLTHFGLRNRLLYEQPLKEGEFAWAVVYAVCYAAVVLAVAMLCFDRKRF